MVRVGVVVRVSVRCREFIIMINSKFAANSDVFKNLLI